MDNGIYAGLTGTNENLLRDGEPRNLLDVEDIKRCQKLEDEIFFNEETYGDYEVENASKRYATVHGMYPIDRIELLRQRKDESSI